MSDDFSWTAAESAGEVIVATQPAIAVYINARGGITLRQEGTYGVSEDNWVYMSPVHARTVANAILRLAGIDQADDPDQDQPAPDQADATAPKAMSNAERQRRHRQRRVTGVTAGRNEHNDNDAAGLFPDKLAGE